MPTFKSHLLPSLLLACLLAALAGSSILAAPDDTTIISLGPNGVQANEHSYASSISDDGRFVAFMSYASNLVSDDTNSYYDIFVFDRQTSLMERVSLGPGGTQANADSNDPSISADGRFVAFESNASNLVSGDTNSSGDIFVHDRQTGLTECVTLGSSGVDSSHGSYQPSISDDGRFVAFMSYADNLVSGDTNMRRDIFVFDRQTGLMERVSLGPGRVEANAVSYAPSISADGRFVAFMSEASNLVGSDLNSSSDIFIHDRQTGATERISVGPGGAEANADSNDPSISADGRFVAFDSHASNLVSGDTNGIWDIFVFDRQTGLTEGLTPGSSGVDGSHGSYQPSVSADGHFVAFVSDANNLVSGDTNGKVDIFVHNRVEGTTQRVSLGPGGVEANADSYAPSISAVGRFVVFESGASTLVSGDTNGSYDIFLHENDVAITPPTVKSITRTDPSPTSASSVQFTITFSEAVAGVDASDFSFTKTGSITDYAITDVSPASGPADSYTVSIATGQYNGSLRLDLLDNDSIQDEAGNSLGGPGNGNGDFTSGQAYTLTKKYKTTLIARPRDGWIIESGENTNKGGMVQGGWTYNNLFLGDDVHKRQYRSLLSFTTAGLPDNAILTKVVLRVKKRSVVGGGNPVDEFQGLLVDVKQGFFGSAPRLEIRDFQAKASQSYGPFKPGLANNWYSINLTSARDTINKLETGLGITQIRLRFKLDDNNDPIANYLRLYSGKAPVAETRPQLIIEYYVP